MAYIARMYYVFFFFKQKTAYEMRISDWSSDVCSSDLRARGALCRSPLDQCRAADRGGFAKLRARKEARDDPQDDGVGARRRGRCDRGGEEPADRQGEAAALRARGAIDPDDRRRRCGARRRYIEDRDESIFGISADRKSKRLNSRH